MASGQVPPPRADGSSVQLTADQSSCPICLLPMEDASLALECRHSFCYECITRWVQQRNRCPLCRQVVRFIRHNVPGPEPHTHQLVQQDEEVAVPQAQQGFILNFGFLTMVQTPMDSPLFVVQPVSVPGTALFRYMVRELEPDHRYFLGGIREGAIWVDNAEQLARVVQALESRGITRIEAGLHQSIVNSELHTSFLGQHRAHHQGGGGQGRPPGPDVGPFNGKQRN